jgi:hypothetical protein
MIIKRYLTDRGRDDTKISCILFHQSVFVASLLFIDGMHRVRCSEYHVNGTSPTIAGADKLSILPDLNTNL